MNKRTMIELMTMLPNDIEAFIEETDDYDSILIKIVKTSEDKTFYNFYLQI